MFKEEELNYILRDSTPEILVAQDAFLPIVRQLLRVKEKKLKVLVVGKDALMSDDAQSFDVLCKTERNDGPVTLNLGPDDEAVIGFTSGTTGFPKGAVHTHKNIILHLDGMGQSLKFDDKDVFLASLPFFN